MRDDLLQATIGAEALFGSLGQTAVDKVLALLRHVDAMLLRIREEDGLRLDELVHLRVVLVAGVKGRESNDHLVSQYAEGPPVDGESVALLLQNLWSEVLGRAAE